MNSTRQRILDLLTHGPASTPAVKEAMPEVPARQVRHNLATLRDEGEIELRHDRGPVAVWHRPQRARVFETLLAIAPASLAEIAALADMPMGDVRDQLAILEGEGAVVNSMVPGQGATATRWWFLTVGAARSAEMVKAKLAEAGFVLAAEPVVPGPELEPIHWLPRYGRLAPCGATLDAIDSSYNSEWAKVTCPGCLATTDDPNREPVPRSGPVTGEVPTILGGAVFPTGQSDTRPPTVAELDPEVYHGLSVTLGERTLQLRPGDTLRIEVLPEPAPEE